MVLPVVSLVRNVRFQCLELQSQSKSASFKDDHDCICQVDTYLVDLVAPLVGPVLAGDVDGDLVNLKVDKGPLALADAVRGGGRGGESVHVALVPRVGPGVAWREAVEEDVDVKGRQAAGCVYWGGTERSVSRVFLLEDSCVEGKGGKMYVLCRLTSDDGLDERGLVLRVREDGVRVENVPDGHGRRCRQSEEEWGFDFIFGSSNLDSTRVSSLSNRSVG